MRELIPVHAYLGEYPPAAAVYGNSTDTLGGNTAEADNVSDILAAVAAVGAVYSLCTAEIILITVYKSLLRRI